MSRNGIAAALYLKCLFILFLCFGSTYAVCFEGVGREKRALILEILSINGSREVNAYSIDLAAEQAVMSITNTEQFRQNIAFYKEDHQEVVFNMTRIAKSIYREQFIESGFIEDITIKKFGALFSEPELKSLIKFYKSDAGKKFAGLSIGDVAPNPDMNERMATVAPILAESLAKYTETLTLEDFTEDSAEMISFSRVQAGSEVSIEERKFFIDNHIVFESEEIIFYFMEGYDSYFESGYVLTDTKLVTFHKLKGGEIQSNEILFNLVTGIDKVDESSDQTRETHKVSWGGQYWSKISIPRKDNGNVEFINALKRQIDESKNQ